MMPAPCQCLLLVILIPSMVHSALGMWISSQGDVTIHVKLVQIHVDSAVSSPMPDLLSRNDTARCVLCLHQPCRVPTKVIELQHPTMCAMCSRLFKWIVNVWIFIVILLEFSAYLVIRPVQPVRMLSTHLPLRVSLVK